MSNEGEVYFKLYGNNFDPNAVTSLIGLEPSSVQVKSNPIPKVSIWKFSLGKYENEIIDIYQMSNDLISRLNPYQENIISAINNFNLQSCLQVVLTISIKQEISTPAIGFESNVIDFLNKVGATIDIDTYKK